MNPFFKRTKNVNLTIKWEDDSQDFQPNDVVDPIELKGGTLFPGSDDDD